jgi:aspartyl-tRNA(Asn)/glutamyl-tRNA(Gln) amidotransferase subunit C
MPAFSKDDVARVAALAHLELTADEQALFERQLSSILEYAAQVQAVDTRDVEPTTHVLVGGARWRDDRVTDSIPRDEALANAPATRGGLFAVPRVIGG